MKQFFLRCRVTERTPSKASIHCLDWLTAASQAKSTVLAQGSYFRETTLGGPALDLLRTAAGVYCADKVTPRRLASDSWTRDIQLSVPVGNVAAANRAKAHLEIALSFLSGDHWTLDFRPDPERPEEMRAPLVADAIGLLSGGLDSLVSAANAAELGSPVLLIGHFESGTVSHDQSKLVNGLRHQYGNHLRQLQFKLGPAAPKSQQARPLPVEREVTTRTRSFLFISAGLAAANSVDEAMPLTLPENGFVGLNVPLTPARMGSLSTRTTHPYFLEELAEAVSQFGISNKFHNPFFLMTKGEVIKSLNKPTAVEQLLRSSVSCARADQGRWTKATKRNCGYCFPCLMRRAGMHTVKLDDGTDYRLDVLSDKKILHPNIARGSDLRALLSFLSVKARPVDVLKNGPLPSENLDAFFSLYVRGRTELFNWLDAGAQGPLRKRLPKWTGQ